MGKKKPAIQTIERLSEDSKRFIDELQKQPDHVAAILAGEWIAAILESLLRAYFLDDADVNQNLFGRGGALSTFVSRIYSAYALGLIGPKVYRDLNTIRDIRNLFAHSMWRKHLADPEVSEKCRNLVTSAEFFEMQDQRRSDSPCHDEREHLIISSVFIADRLLLTGLSQKHRTAGTDIGFVLDNR